MIYFRLGRFPVGLALIALLAIVAQGSGQPQTPTKKDAKQQTDPLKALQEEFSKSVTTTPVDPKELPKEISDGAAKVRPGGSIKKAQKMEIRRTLKYAAFDQPQVQHYEAVLVKDDKRSLIHVAPDGKKWNTRPLADKNAETAKPADTAKEIDIPAKASKAVKAIKELYPDAVVLQITTEVYQDPSGIIDVLTYEIEFLNKGAKREMVASPDGVIPHLWKPVAVKDLPKPVAEMLAKQGGKVDKVTQFEIRAGLQFVPLEKPRIVYQLEMEKDGTSSKLNLRADGSVVPPPARPGPQNSTYLGVSLKKDSTIVSQVAKDGPADRAGIKAGDRLLRMGDANVKSYADLVKALQSLKPGAVVKVQLQRGERTLTVSVKLAAPPGP